VLQDELEIDEGEFSISFKGLTCNLGNTIRFKIFCCLNKQLGKNVPINDLMNAVWDQDTERNTINKQISLLRKSLSKIKDVVIESNGNNTYSMSIKTR
jgi:DNA-binding response OmpR family regulator